MRVIIDGEAVDARTASISVFDLSLVRGLGAFEVLKTADGRARFLDDHLDRLEHSLAVMAMPDVDRDAIAGWVASVAAENDDGLVRVIVTAGSRDTAAVEPVTADPKVIVVWEPAPQVPDSITLVPMRAPWHPGTAVDGFAGTKWLSYAPNMLSIDRAVAAGFDDALLTTIDDVVLELPTACVAWVAAGRLVTPSLDLGILPSITRRATLEIAHAEGIEVLEGELGLADLLDADEVMVLSTARPVVPVTRVGSTEFEHGPVTERLSQAYREASATR